MPHQKQEQKRSPYPYSAAKISVAYLLLGYLWIIFSDPLAKWMVDAYPQLKWLETGKGLFFITFTAFLLYLLIRRQQRNILQTNETLEHEVSARTLDLETLNKDLLTANEEFTSTNEELSVTNEQLVAAYAKIKQQSDTILKQKDEQLNRVLEKSNDAIFSIDLTGQGNHYVSRSARALFGETMEAQLTDAGFWTQQTHPEDLAIRREGEKMLSATGKAEFAIRIKDGRGGYRWMYERHHILYENNKPVRHEGIASDITELRKQEDTVKRYRENLDILFANTIEEILLLDTKGCIVLFNKSFEQFIKSVTGKIPEVGQPLWEATVPERAETSKALFQKALNGTAVVVDAVVTRNDRTVIHELRYNSVRINGEVKYVSIISVDVTERRKKEQQVLKLSESLSDFQNAIYRSSIVSRADVHGIITMVNQNFVNISGYSEKELVGNNHRIINSGYHPKSFWVEMWKTIASGKIWREDVKNRAKDGRYYWVDTFIMPFIDEKGRVREFLSIRNDITARKDAEESLRHNRKLLDSANEVAKIGYWDYDLATKKVSWNERTLTLLGLPPHFDGGVNEYLALVHPHDRAQVTVALDEALRAGHSFGFDHRIVKHDGATGWVHLEATMMHTEQGQPDHLLGIIQDISRQKEFEERITTIARELTSLIENANVPIFGVDRHGYINEWNKVAVELTGYSKNEVLERKWTDLLPPDQHPRLNALLERVSGGHPVSNYELPFLNRRGNNLVFFLSASPRKDIRNEIVGVIFVAQDLTELIDYRSGLEKLVEDRTKELKLALSKEKELVEMKSKFVSIASHEFRTPLTTITIANAFLRKHHQKMAPAEVERKLDTIDKQVHHMTYLLDDVLTIGKAEAGKLEVQFSNLHIPSLVNQLVGEVQQGNATHQVEVVWRHGARHEIYCDEKLMRNILINLLTNAIKFSPEAERVQLTLGGDRDTFEITVRDRGIGIPAHDLDKLFQSFQRGSNVGTIDGTGLGLSIVKKAVDLLEGTISVKSEEGRGTEFVVRLPQQQRGLDTK